MFTRLAGGPAHQRGIIQPLVAVGITILILVIPATVKLVEQRQEIRKKASIAEPCKVCSGGRCITVASPPMCTSSLNECSSNSDCAQPTPTPPPPEHECFTPEDCEAPGRCNVDCRGWPRKCRWTSCPEPTPTSPPEPTSPPPDHECFTPEDCQAPGRCNVDCRGWPRKCYWTACAAPTPTPTIIPSCKQKNEYCSGTGQGDCCPALMCAPLPGGKFCITPGCQEGNRKCSYDGGFVQECQNGQWVNVQRCDAGCSNATCSRICSPGTTRCADSQTQETCSSDGGAWGKRSCPYGCSGGKCQAAPTPTPTPIPPTMTPTPIPTATPRPTASPTPVWPTLRPTSIPSPTPAPITPPLVITPQIYRPTIQPTFPFAGITVGYGSIPPGYPTYPSRADIALERELEPLTEATAFVVGISLLGAPLVGTAPEWAPAALTYAYVQLQTLPPAVQTALQIAELAGTGYLAYECSHQENQDACMAGMVGGQMYLQQRTVEAMARSQAINQVAVVEAEFQQRLSEGTIDVSYSTEVGSTARGFIRNVAPTIEGSLNQPEAVKEVMEGFKYATQVGQDKAAWGYLGLEKPNLDAVVQCGWGGCYELAELSSRLANAGGLEAHPVGLFEETFGGHFVTYFPKQNLILDPSRSPIELLSPFEYFQKYGVSKFVLPR